MKKILLIVLCISLISFVKNDSPDDATRYFEGQVIYDIDYTPYNPNIAIDRLKELIGSKMVLTFKKGNYKKEYYSSNGKLLQQRFLKLKDEKSYQKLQHTDTIFWIDITNNDTKTTFKIKKDSLYKGHSCKVITTKSIVTGESFGDEIIEVEGVFMYAQDLPINPDWYANFYEGNFNEIAKEGKGIAVVTINKGLYWEQRITLNKIINRKVKNKEITLTIPKDTPLVKL